MIELMTHRLIERVENRTGGTTGGAQERGKHNAGRPETEKEQKNSLNALGGMHGNVGAIIATIGLFVKKRDSRLQNAVCRFRR